MKIHKLKKGDFKSLYDLYSRLDCTYENRHAFPYHTFVSPKTYKLIEKTIAQEYKKEAPYANKRKIDYYVAMHLLNLGPCTLQGLPDNVILVDTKSIEDCKEDLKNE